MQDHILRYTILYDPDNNNMYTISQIDHFHLQPHSLVTSRFAFRPHP